MTRVLLSDPSKGTVARASSILHKNVKLYGPMNALDSENISSCWYSEGFGRQGQGKSSGGAAGQPEEEARTDAVEGEQQQQWFMLDFGRLVHPRIIRVQFQAGFVAESVRIDIGKDPRRTKQEEKQKEQDHSTAHEICWNTILEDEELEDVHGMQSINLPIDDDDDDENEISCTSMKLFWSEPTDFYGRLTIYRIEVLGEEEHQQHVIQEDHDGDTNATMPGQAK